MATPNIVPGQPVAACASQQALTYRQAARALGVSERTVFQLIKERKLAAFNAGRSVRIASTAIDAFIASGGATLSTKKEAR